MAPIQHNFRAQLVIFETANVLVHLLVGGAFRLDKLYLCKRRFRFGATESKPKPNFGFCWNLVSASIHLCSLPNHYAPARASNCVAASVSVPRPPFRIAKSFVGVQQISVYIYLFSHGLKGEGTMTKLRSHLIQLPAVCAGIFYFQNCANIFNSFHLPAMKFHYGLLQEFPTICFIACQSNRFVYVLNLQL